ncbi:MAG: alginate export family protein [Acidobacteria bacterium]|nr:alginate export family protein [Acidobacteriota bacterium]
MRRFPRTALLLLIALTLPPARARAAEEPKDLAWSLSGEARFRPEWRDDADLDRDVDDDTRLAYMRIRIGLNLAYREEYRLFVQAQDSRAAGQEASSATNERNLDLHQGYLEATLGEGRRLTLTLGRQELAYGDDRLIGAFGWDNVGRAFDGLRARFAGTRLWIDGFLARVTSRTSGPATEGSDLYGVYARIAPRPGAEYDVYGIGFQDSVLAAGETGAPGSTRIHALGGRAKDRFGRFDFRVEAVAERGTFRGDDLRAHAAAAQAGLTWGKDAKTRFFAGYDFATGDRDPADGERQEFFNFFPTNHPHYGYADLEGWRNLESPYAGVSFTRGRHFGQARTHRFRLDEAAGPWKDAGGIQLGLDPLGASGTDVGVELDLTYRFAWSAKATLEVGYSRFEPRRFARLKRGDDALDWGYVMATFGF